jgi:hypothetical protein
MENEKWKMTNDWFLGGVGIEPTYRAFQTRANPSQLSDQTISDLSI